jgi:hypothetical protein
MINAENFLVCVTRSFKETVCGDANLLPKSTSGLGCLHEDRSSRGFLVTGCLLGLFFNPEEGGSVFLRKVDKLVSDYKTVVLALTAVVTSDPTKMIKFFGAYS